MDTNTCPACRETMRPTSYKEVRGQGGQVIRRLPLTWDCASSCQHVLGAEEWNEAVSQYEREQRGDA
ncbi:hypothetical protein [Actinomadura citrea]|uniref:Uncharacterized protein n=1 Tax=Actinomadura citrea TaxID=46158 RepID=A0A7Y9KDC7_9ACTN|nr:hypothetical protein [Actinomadura citrea]NYE13236.1 hypothetical protein [Actinomadura citrea]GGU04954.1 hypothetical protein GCM10010177_75390 [Actinomadura citrea]